MYNRINFNEKSKELKFFEILVALVIAFLIVNIQFLIFHEWEFYVDNVYYKKAFNGIEMQSSFVNSYLFFVWQTAGSEPLAFLTFFIFSKITDYQNFIYYTDVFFYTLIILFYRRRKINFFLIFLFLICNYYFLIMSISGHRIKIAFCFFFLALLLKNKIKSKIIYLIPLFHFQFFTIHISVMISIFFEKLNEGKINRKVLTIIFITISTIIGLAFFSKIWTKFYGRITFDYLDFLVALIITKLFLNTLKINDLRIKYYLFSICFLILLLGGFRMNMVLFISFIFISSFLSKKQFIQFNILSSFYLLYKIITLYYGHYSDNLLYGEDENIHLIS